MLDASPAVPTLRPAGVLAGTAALTPTAGGGFDAMLGDLLEITHSPKNITQVNSASHAEKSNIIIVINRDRSSRPAIDPFGYILKEIVAQLRRCGERSFEEGLEHLFGDDRRLCVL